MMTTTAKRIEVDVVVPVHNAASTIEEAARSAMVQGIPDHLLDSLRGYSINISVCCYDDGSKDDSWPILERLKEEYSKAVAGTDDKHKIPSTLLIQKSPDNVARGAGYARNRAIELHSLEKTESSSEKILRFLCLLDSDDTMHRHRIAEQTNYMLQLKAEDRYLTLLGCTFDRDPPDSTWHYSRWANTLSDERLMLERFREVTILQPTWFLCRSRWSNLGGYIEAPPPGSDQTAAELLQQDEDTLHPPHLIHPHHDNPESLRLAEDLRFFHEHLNASGTVRRHRTDAPLVTYRHTGTSQSFRTSRKLLLQLRALAFERSVLRSDPRWQLDDGQFVIWGAGRDGKEFLKALSVDMRKRVYCFVDVDAKKLAIGTYANRDLGLRIPIIHFSFLAKDKEVRRKIQQGWEDGSAKNDEVVGRINKTKDVSGDKGGPEPLEPKETAQPQKKRKTCNAPKLELAGLCPSKLQKLPVVVCVAMYRTNGVLERNVKAIGRDEGTDLWHFS